MLNVQRVRVDMPKLASFPPHRHPQAAGGDSVTVTLVHGDKAQKNDQASTIGHGWVDFAESCNTVADVRVATKAWRLA